MFIPRTGEKPGPFIPSRGSRIGGMIGATIGGCGWAIGLGVVGWSAGAWSAVRSTVVMGLLASAGLGLLLCLVAELTIRVFGSGSRWCFVTLAGGCAVVIGTLLLLLNHWVAPLIERTPALHDPPWIIGDARTATWVPPVVIAVGVGLLAASIVRLLREPGNAVATACGIPPDGPGPR
jgi:hypothetical protein